MTARPCMHLDRRGIALPMVLLVTLILTISLGAGLLISGNEHEVGSDHNADLKAFAVAQEGVERYLTDVTTLPATLPDVRTISVPGGTATVTLRLFRASTGPTVQAVYSVTAIGKATSAGLRRSYMTPIAERTISQFVVWQSAPMSLDGTLVSLSGLQKNGSSGMVSGVDACVGSGKAPIAGVAVPNGLFDQNGGSTNWIDGNPDNAPQYIGTPGPTGTAKDSVDIDWASITNGTLAPDFVLDRTNGHHNGTWPTVSQFNNWPVVMVKGDVVNADNVNGKGVLIVTGNADFSNITWHGVVLIGGTIGLSGNATRVYGSLVSGLNVMLGQTVGESSIGNGNYVAQYNSCDIASALLKFAGWRRVQNTWADNWPDFTVP